MIKEEFESGLDGLIDTALATMGTEDVIASLEYMISEIRTGGFDLSLPADK